MNKPSAITVAITVNGHKHYVTDNEPGAKQGYAVVGYGEVMGFINADRQKEGKPPLSRRDVDYENDFLGNNGFLIQGMLLDVKNGTKITVDDKEYSTRVMRSIMRKKTSKGQP